MFPKWHESNLFITIIIVFTFSPRASRSISLKVVLVVVVLVVVLTNYKLSRILSFLQFQDGTFRTSNYFLRNAKNNRKIKSRLERAVQNVSHSVSVCYPKLLLIGILVSAPAHHSPSLQTIISKLQYFVTQSWQQTPVQSDWSQLTVSPGLT